jgi:hypothetical protein
MPPLDGEGMTDTLAGLSARTASALTRNEPTPAPAEAITHPKNHDQGSHPAVHIVDLPDAGL